MIWAFDLRDDGNEGEGEGWVCTTRLWVVSAPTGVRGRICTKIALVGLTAVVRCTHYFFI